MNQHQAIAHEHMCLIGEECVHPRFSYEVAGGSVSIILTLNAGFE